VTVDEKTEDAREKLAVLDAATDLDSLLRHKGWNRIQRLQMEQLESAKADLRSVDTSDPMRALDALRRWQICANLIELQSNHIHDTFTRALEIRGAITVEDALFMEKVNNEQQPAGTADPTGY
jgi:hypothetical protein